MLLLLFLSLLLNHWIDQPHVSISDMDLSPDSSDSKFSNRYSVLGTSWYIIPTCFCSCCLSCFALLSLGLGFASVIANVSGYKMFHSNNAIIGAEHTILFSSCPCICHLFNVLHHHLGVLSPGGLLGPICTPCPGMILIGLPSSSLGSPHFRI